MEKPYIFEIPLNTLHISFTANGYAAHIFFPYWHESQETSIKLADHHLTTDKHLRKSKTTYKPYVGGIAKSIMYPVNAASRGQCFPTSRKMWRKRFRYLCLRKRRWMVHIRRAIIPCFGLITVTSVNCPLSNLASKTAKPPRHIPHQKSMTTMGPTACRRSSPRGSLYTHISVRKSEPSKPKNKPRARYRRREYGRIYKPGLREKQHLYQPATTIATTRSYLNQNTHVRCGYANNCKSFHD